MKPAQRRWLEAQVASGRFRTVDDALRFCVDQASAIDREKARIDGLLIEAADSPAEDVDERWWAGLRREAAARARARRRSA
jgi:Arc/MetJ-type ribon-helix-helix transcriptional regulator